MPISTTNEHVADALKKVPDSPGCYIYRDEQDVVLYVGKAVSLKSRVRSYFQKSARHGPRIARLVSKVRQIEWIVVDSELEALVLECTLIKEHRPPYNVRLRDDKSYPYIAITKEKFPRVLFVRRPRPELGKAYGPYSSAWAVRETLGLLHQVFPLIPCGKSWSGRREQRPCLYYHLKQCLAPCAGIADAKEYAEVVKQVERFLQGKADAILDDLRRQMERAAERLEFEEAAAMRDKIQSIERVLEKQKVLSTDESDRDVIAVVKDERGSAIQMLYVRGGKLIGQHQFFLDGAAEAAPAVAVQEFVKQYYSTASEIPREILLPVEIEERNIVQTWLRGRRGAAVTIEVPGGGEKLRLVEMAATNAEQALKTFQLELEQQEQWGDSAMAELQEALDLPGPPRRVEGYDISNLQGTAPVGSMVVTEDAVPAKAEYRRFKIRYHPEDPNDFAMMHEVLTRRLRALREGDEKFAKAPDLIMIDGGRGQLMAALKARDEQGLDIPMVGLAKKQELLIVPVPVVGFEDEKPVQPPSAEADGTKDPGYSYESPALRRYAYRTVELPLNSPGLLLLRRLRDEAHRFALTFHRKVRDKRAVGSTLEEVPGIGPRRKRLLLRTFGSVEGIRRASIEEIAAVPTMTTAVAALVKSHLDES